MATTSQEKKTDRRDEPNETVLLYDAKCGMCRSLAYKFRHSTATEVEIVALSSPEASRILDEFYPDGWDHDYYLVTDGVCRKGIQALPGIGKIAGIRNSSSLIREYASHKFHSSQCDGCDHEHDHDHDHDKHHGDQDKRSIGGRMSRRTFAGMLSAAAIPLSPITELASAKNANQHPKPPKDLQVHVASVAPDGQGGFEAEIQNRPDLAFSKHPLKGEKLKNKVGKESSSRYQSSESDNAKLFAGSLDTGASLQIRKMEKSIRPQNPEPQMREAMRMQGDAQRAHTTSYHGLVDHQRFGLSTHVGRGPAVSESVGPTVRTTMTGTIEHDTAQPVIDFLVSTTDETHASTHLDAYVTGIRALREFYAKRDNTEMATLYGNIEDGMQEVQKQFEANVDDQQLMPVSNHVAISGLPGYEGFAEPPADAQPDQKVGYNCALTCVCTLDPVCCGCGVGCGLCLPSPCKVCGCCKGYCGCSYSCCL